MLIWTPIIFVQQEDYFLGKCFEAMEVDSLSSSHPVSTPVENPAQIQEMFDDVSYDKVHYKTWESFPVKRFSFLFFKLFKSMLRLWMSFQGACILNMLREFLSPEAFKLGIVRYLKRYSYQNTINSNLWESLTNVSTRNAMHATLHQTVWANSFRSIQNSFWMWNPVDTHIEFNRTLRVQDQNVEVLTSGFQRLCYRFVTLMVWMRADWRVMSLAGAQSQTLEHLWVFANIINLNILDSVFNWCCDVFL